MTNLFKSSVFILFLSLFIFNQVEAQEVTDRQGNVYSTIKVGDKVWMGEDLRMTKAQAIDVGGGKLIDPPMLVNAKEASDWQLFAQREMGAYSSYNNEPLIDGGKNGYLYNWYAIKCNICPTGYRIPSADELKELIAFQAKEKKNVGDGIRKENGEFANGGSSQKTYWSKTESIEGNALNGCAFTNNGISWSDGVSKGAGFYIRCILD